jgi:hypothetical protein
MALAVRFKRFEGSRLGTLVKSYRTKYAYSLCSLNPDVRTRSEPLAAK